MRSLLVVTVMAGAAFAGAPKAPKLTAIQKQLKDPKVDGHLTALLVDETCFPSELDAKSPRGASLETSREDGKAVESNWSRRTRFFDSSLITA